MRLTVPLRAVAAAVLALTACKKASNDAAAPQPSVLVINASEYAFTAPDTTPAGVTRIRLVNAGHTLHHAQLLKLEGGKTFDSLVLAFRSPGPPPSWITWIGSPNAAGPGDTVEVTSTLDAGRYAIICVIPDSAGAPHFVHGMMRPLEVTPVTGLAARAAEPEADIEMHLTDYAFTESKPLTAGTHTIKAVNDAQQPHEMVLVKLDSGATVQQLVDWVHQGMHGRPPARPMGGFVGIQPGGHSFITVTLTPGNYGLICFLPDAKDGREHAAHGMIRQFTI